MRNNGHFVYGLECVKVIRVTLKSQGYVLSGTPTMVHDDKVH